MPTTRLHTLFAYVLASTEETTRRDTTHATRWARARANQRRIVRPLISATDITRMYTVPLLFKDDQNKDGMYFVDTLDRFIW